MARCERCSRAGAHGGRGLRAARCVLGPGPAGLLLLQPRVWRYGRLVWGRGGGGHGGVGWDCRWSCVRQGPSRKAGGPRGRGARGIGAVSAGGAGAAGPSGAAAGGPGRAPDVSGRGGCSCGRRSPKRRRLRSCAHSALPQPPALPHRAGKGGSGAGSGTGTGTAGQRQPLGSGSLEPPRCGALAPGRRSLAAFPAATSWGSGRAVLPGEPRNSPSRSGGAVPRPGTPLPPPAESRGRSERGAGRRLPQPGLGRGELRRVGASGR